VTRASLFALLALAACSTPPAAPIDAAAPIDMGTDAGTHGVRWSTGPDLPLPLAYATAQVIAFNHERYLWVFGGANGTRTTLGTATSIVLRAHILADGTLEAWQHVGDITVGGAAFPLVGSASLPNGDAMGNPGAIFAGGGSSHGFLPIVLAVYVNPADGSLFDWSRYPPTLDLGQSFGTFVQLDALNVALVGGVSGTTIVDRVRVASLANGSTQMTFADGPGLPTPRARHVSFVRANQVYLLGGENVNGALTDVIRTTRDASGAAIGWEPAGTLDAPAVAAAAMVLNGEAWILGGIDNDSFDGNATDRVRRARFDGGNQLGSWTDDVPLPMPIAASAFATDYETVFLVGGQNGPDLTATTSVIIGQVY
jgi:hypothetical protein